jgi:hypothetical protein
MKNPSQTIGWRFIRVIGSLKAYRNLVYLLAAFPLGLFYFVFLISGLSTGISLSIVWVGIPILVLVGAGWWLLARFERLMARIWLEEDIPRKEDESTKPANLWVRFFYHLTNPVTWKSLIYLFIKFPLGMVSFVIVITLGALTLALLSSPFLFGTHQFFQDGDFFGLALLDFQVDSMKEAILAALAGLILLPLTLHIFNGLAWLHGKFARLMLSD